MLPIAELDQVHSAELNWCSLTLQTAHSALKSSAVFFLHVVGTPACKIRNHGKLRETNFQLTKIDKKVCTDDEVVLTEEK